jgi:hypothetical protein
MAHAIALDAAMRDLLTIQVRNDLPVGLQPAADLIALGSTFEVWTLSRLADDFDNMAATATRTNSYHHQLLNGSVAVGFARSHPADHDQSREITKVVRSPLGERIDSALLNIDRLLPGDEIARLVTVPQFQLFVFWFVGANKCYVVSCPDTLKGLRSDDWLDGADFLRRVRKETPIAGAVFSRG